jgi:hypothetical protein
MALLQMVQASGGGGVAEYATWADLVAASPAPADGAEALAGDVLMRALSGVWLPEWMPRTSYLSAYSFLKADASLGASLTLGATGTKSAGVALVVAGSGAGTPAVSGTLPAEKGTILLRGVTGTAGGGATAAERGWLLLRSASNNCTYSLLLPKLSSATAQRMDGNGVAVGRSAAMASPGIVAVWWDFTAAAGGCGLWTPTDTGARGGAGVTVIRSDLAAGGASHLRLFPSLSGTAGYSVEDWLTWTGA